MNRLLSRQDEIDDVFDPTDLSFIANLAAIGDSYSAGIGAGNRLGSILDVLDSQSVTKDVLKEQIPRLKSGQDAIMLSIGGNDAELKNILNQCVFQWTALNWEVVTVAEVASILDSRFGWIQDFNLEEYGRGREMNNLVDLINIQLKLAADRAGPDVIFINYDSYVGEFGGRYCEAGVDESSSDSNTRTGLMFYELRTSDPFGNTPWKRSPREELNTTFQGQLATLADITLALDPNATFADPAANSNMESENENSTPAISKLSVGIPNPMPDGYGRIFHPQILLHEIIANLVAWNMMNVKQTSNGFRKPLRDALRQEGWKVNMVGSKKNGDMMDNNVEAHSGDRIDQIQTASALSTKYKPNIVVINGGTNDCIQSHDIDNFGARYNSLLDSLFDAIPDVTIIASLVLPGTVDGIIRHRDSVNSQIRRLVSDRRSRKKQKIVLADVDSPSEFFTTQHLNSDGIHPNDEGHRRLAAIYLRAIQEANGAGFLSSPADTSFSDEAGVAGGKNCEKEYGSGEAHGPVTTQEGSGLDDGPYVHSSTIKGSQFSITAEPNFNYTFARILHPFGNHDFLEIGDASTIGRQYRMLENIGAGWSPYFTFFELKDACIARGVRWVDVNADGLDDMVCIAVNGDAFVSINQGQYKFSSPTLWKSNEGSVQDHVRLGDIDGDGRADYCTLADNGDMSCWRNGGQGPLPEYWQPLGVIFTGKGMGDLNGVRLVDLNGDGRDDWIWVSNTGRTWTYTNNRGCTKGTLAPLWRQGTNPESNEGYTHGGMGREVGRSAIHFAKVFRVPSAFSLGGRADYVWVEDVGPSNGGNDNGLHKFNINVWQNKGSGATKLKADGDRYCNMLGHQNGAMDYIWVHSTGYMILYESFGGSFPDSPPYWGPHRQIWAATDSYGFEIDRRDLHLADWDGDGLCDIIYVKPDTGEMEVWLNKLKKNGNIEWKLKRNVGPSGEQRPCPEKKGVGIFDLAVRFADIDGNGRADYLCIEKDGRTWGYLNNDDGSLTHISQFKKTEGKDRANLRWVDVNGDGRDDLLWVDKFTGDASVWYNEGPVPASGSAFTWKDQGPAYQGAGQGSCLQWADLDGDGRADMSLVDSLTNQATTWFNICSGQGSGNGDDQDTLTSELLPAL
ncbi:hypothetical protein DV738_g4290, partial [Chaetothyriales sp. CBS 135597]